MRIQFRSTRHALTVSKRIKKLLRLIGIRLTDGKSMEATAKMFGYSDWHELETATSRFAGLPSPWDDEVEEAVQATREKMFVSRLADALGIATDVAGSVIADIGPTRRSSKVMTVPEWRRMKNKLEQEDGFVSLTLRASGTQIREDFSSSKHRSPHWGDKKHRCEIEHAGKMYEILLSRSVDLHGDDFAVHDIHSFMFSGDEVVGIFNCTVVKSKTLVSGSEFYRGCDDCSQWLADMADLLVDQYPSAEFLGNGNSFLLVKRWEVKTGSLPAGAGMTMLSGVAKILKKTDKRFGALALAVDPSQYCAVPLNERIKKRSYKEAVSHLWEYFIQAGPHRELGDKVELMLLSRSPKAESPHAELLSRFRKHFPTASNGDFEPGDLSQVTMSSMRDDVLDLSDLDETEDGQPLAIPPEKVPEDFNIEWAVTVKSYKPSEKIWQLMPDDLIEIVVNYRSDEYVDVTSVEYRFANGTSLDMPVEYLLFGEMFDFYPDALKTASGWRIRRNPYTSRYSLADLFGVLKINSAFLFDGLPSDRIINPGKPVVLKRSDAAKLS